MKHAYELIKRVKSLEDNTGILISAQEKEELDIKELARQLNLRDDKFEAVIHDLAQSIKILKETVTENSRQIQNLKDEDLYLKNLIVNVERRVDKLELPKANGNY